MTTPVDRNRAAALTAAALTAGAALAAVPVDRPPLEGADLIGWWETAGTQVAVVAMLRLIGLGLAAWLALVGALGVVAATIPSRSTRRALAAMAPAAMRRLLLAGAAAGLASCSVSAGAQETPPTPQLVDLGEAPLDAGRPPLLVDLGPAPVAGSSTGTAPPGPPGPPPAHEQAADPVTAADGAETRRGEPETWRVEPGDHLWSIATEIVRERDGADDEATVARYWRRLIDANREAIGPDPDLVHPGLVLTLPG